MNPDESVHQHIEAARRRINALHRDADDVSPEARPRMGVALQELQVAMEELRVTEEELRQQNESLAESREALEEARERYRDLFHFAPDPYLVTDREGVIREANRAAAALLRVRECSLAGKPLAVYVDPGERRAFRARLAQLARGEWEERVTDWDLRLHPRDGAPVQVSCTVGAVRGSRGPAGSLRWILRDVTERNRAEEAARSLAGERARRAEAEAAQERITGILESIADGFFALDAEGRFTYLNRSAEAVLQRGREELLGRPFAEVFTEREHPRLHRELRRAVAECAVAELEEHDPARDAWLELRVYPAPDGGATVYFRDVSERKTREETERFLTGASEILAASLDHRATLQSIARLVAGTLADYCTVHTQENGELRAPGIAHADPAREEIVRGLLRRFPVGPESAHPVARTLRTGEPQLIPEIDGALLEEVATGAEHLEMLRDLGLASALVVPLQARGRTLGALSLGRVRGRPPYGPADLALALELARRAALAADNARLYDEARQAARARDEVLAVVSHDLRNPLHAVLLAATVLEEFSHPERWNARERQQIGVIRRSAEQMAQLIEDLVEVISLESRAPALHRERLEVEPLLAGVAELFLPIANDGGITLAVGVAPGVPAVEADRGRITQVFSNLLGNAIKFTPPGGKVTLAAAREGRGVRFSVTDTGPGIPRESLPHLFDRFWQAKQGDRKGLGLGLAIARGIVEAHGGRIWAESEEGTGTTLAFTVPASPF